MINVFIADDEPFILDGLKNIINWNEYDLKIVGQALNGVDAYNYIKNEKVDILITDVMMPEMDGLTLIENIKKTNTNTRFIILSGYNEFEYVKKGIHLGIENYLLKPINFEELISTLQNITKKIKSSNNSFLCSTEDIYTLKNNILYRWVNNSISESELMQRSTILDIDLDLCVYTVCIMSVFSDVKNKTLSKSNHNIENFYRLMKDILQPFDNVTCFPDFNGNVIIIFGGQCQSSLENLIYNTLSVAKNEIRNILKLNTFFNNRIYHILHRNISKLRRSKATSGISYNLSG